MNRSKQKGTAFETAVTKFMRLYYPVERRALQGAHDTGDIAGLTIHGQPIVVECKNTRQLNISEHMKEAIREAQNAHAAFPVLVQHAPRIGFDKPDNTGQQWAILQLSDFMQLLYLAGGNDAETWDTTLSDFLQKVYLTDGNDSQTSTTLDERN